MKNVIGKLVLVLTAIVFLGAGCVALQKNQTPKPAETKNDQRTIKYLISNEDTTKYCNGADMSSIGYRKTITKEETTTTAKGDGTEAELVKSILSVATTGMCQNVMKQLDFKVASGTVFIPPIEGWAGVSITMCSCVPQVEVNLLQMPGIQKVIWQ